MFALTPFGRRFAVDRYNPFRELENWERSVFGDRSSYEFRTDIREEKDAYVLEADLPGVSKKDIKIDIEGNCMTVTAERRNEREESEENGKYIRCERCYGSMTRSFDLTGVKEDAIDASYEDGVLRIRLPKKEKELPQSRQLPIR